MEHNRVLALGFFDGIHLGHAALLNKTCERAKELGGTAAAMSFDTHPDTLVFGDVPLLYECRMTPMFDRIWVVRAPRETQIARLLLRDGLSREEAERRIDAQMPLAQKCALADAVIDTDGPVESTRAQVRTQIDSLIPRRKA